MQKNKRKRSYSAFNLAATLLKLHILFSVATHAEESSILEGATIVNKSDFDSTWSPDPDNFFGVGFKTLLHSDKSSGYLGDGSKEVKI